MLPHSVYADALGVALHIADLPDAENGYLRAFEAMTQARIDGLVVPTSPQFTPDRSSRRRSSSRSTSRPPGRSGLSISPPLLLRTDQVIE